MFRWVSHVPSPTYMVFDEYVLLPAGVSPEDIAGDFLGKVLDERFQRRALP